MLEKSSRMKRMMKKQVHLKSKQLLLIEKCICLTILSVNSACKFPETYLSSCLNVTGNN